MVQRVIEQEVAYPKDMEDFRDFEKLWWNNTLNENHVVMLKVRRWAEGIAYKYNKASRARDLEQDCLMALINSGYNGQAALDTFIVKILLRKNIAAWRKDGAKKQGAMPAEMTDQAGSEFSRAVEARLSSDGLVEELLKSQDKLMTTVVEIITEAEHSIGRLRIAELASERLQRAVTRYQVEVALKKLRDRLEKHSRRAKRKDSRRAKANGKFTALN